MRALAPGQPQRLRQPLEERLGHLDEAYSRFDLSDEVPASHLAVFANCFYREHAQARSDLAPGRRERILGQIRARWAASACAGVPLGVEGPGHG